MQDHKKPVLRRKKHSSIKHHQSSPTGRKQRHDVGVPRLTPRDLLVLTWIGQQYALRLDQIQDLLEVFARQHTHMSESAMRSMIARWEQAGWVYTQRFHAHEPVWVWLTKKGLQRVGLSYQYQNLDSLSKHDHEHLYAITQVRLQLDDGEAGTEWISERTLVQRVKRVAGRKRVHRPDAVFACGDDLIAIEVELSRKTVSLLSSILKSLVHKGDYHGHAYHDLKAREGEDVAQALSEQAWRHYTEVSYYADTTIRKHIRRVLAKLVRQGEISDEEAERISVWWYPFPTTDVEIAQEEHEENASLDLDEDARPFFSEGGDSNK